MGDMASRPVTVAQFILAIVGELLLFVGWIALDRLASEKRTTQLEERLNAIYAQLPKVREGETRQEERLTALEHDVLKLDTEFSSLPGPAPPPKERRRLRR